MSLSMWLVPLAHLLTFCRVLKEPWLASSLKNPLPDSVSSGWDSSQSQQ